MSTRRSMKKTISNVVLISTIIIFTVILVCSTFMQSNVYYSQNHLISFLFVIPIFIIFYNLFRLKRKIRNISFKKTIIFLILYYIVVSIFQFIVLKYLSVNLNWDFGVVFDSAVNYANNGIRVNANATYPEYFQYFPNNIMLFIIEMLFIKIGNLFGIKAIISCYIMNILFVDFALLLLFLVLRKKYDNMTGIIGLIISFFFIPLFLYTPIFYSDTISLFIPLLILLLYLYVDDNKKNYIIFACLGLVLFLGWQIKLSSIFILIAISFDYILNHKKIILNLLLMLSVFIISTILFKTLIVNNEKFEFQQNEYGSYPFTHWIMMGVEDTERDNSGRNSFGGFSADDYNLSRRFATGKEAIIFNISEYLNRVNKMGAVKYSEFLIRKSVNVWTDGYYFADTKLSLKPINSDNTIRRFMFQNKKTKFLMINLTQSVQYVFILFLIIGSIFKLKDNNHKFDYIRLTILGLFVFFLFWEARSRYLFNYIPIFILIIIEGLVRLNAKGSNKKI